MSSPAIFDLKAPMTTNTPYCRSESINFFPTLPPHFSPFSLAFVGKPGCRYSVRGAPPGRLSVGRSVSGD